MILSQWVIVDYQSQNPYYSYSKNQDLADYIVQWISVALENSVERVSCPDNKQYTLLILSGHETSSTEFSNATEIHCKCIVNYFIFLCNCV